jgi:hypothetical protein
MVEFITYQGQKLPIRVSYYVLMMAQKESGLNIMEFEKNLESQQLILYYALVAGHKMAKKELTLTKEDMIWVLDECYLDYQKATFQFAKALIEVQQKALEESTEGNKKK